MGNLVVFYQKYQEKKDQAFFLLILLNNVDYLYVSYRRVLRPAASTFSEPAGASDSVKSHRDIY